LARPADGLSLGERSEIPEVLITRFSPVGVDQSDAPPIVLNRVLASGRPIVPMFIRLAADFKDHVQVRPLSPAQELVLGSELVAYRFGGMPQEILAGTKRPQIEVRSVTYTEFLAMLHQFPTNQGPIVINTSALFELATRNDTLRKELFHAPGIWLVMDTEPRHTLRWVRELIPELNGMSHQPERNDQRVHSLVLRRVGPVGPVEGMVICGSSTMCSLVNQMVWEEYGDNCRGMDVRGFLFHEESFVRDAVAKVLHRTVPMMNRNFRFRPVRIGEKYHAI
jgi:hypothetical protein